MDSSSSSTRKSNKIRDIVRLQQILKKWKKVANNNSSSSSKTSPTTTTKSIKFLKKTLSFSESSSTAVSNSSSVPKGYVAVCVGKELKRFVIRTEYLRHQVFGLLLREAEEEFGFQQEGVLKFPCEVEYFEKILKMMEDKRSFSSPSLMLLLNHDHDHDHDHDHEEEEDLMKSKSCCSSSSNNYSPPHTTDLAPSHHPQMCR